jgi:hypothetical protein
MERFNLKKLNDVELKKQYQVKISNRFVALESMDDDDDDDDDDDVDTIRSWESILREYNSQTLGNKWNNIRYETSNKNKVLETYTEV